MPPPEWRYAGVRSGPVRDGSLVRVYAGARASPKSRPSSTAGLSRPAVHNLPARPSCSAGRAAGSTHGPPPPAVRSGCSAPSPGWSPGRCWLRSPLRRQRAGAGRSTRRWRWSRSSQPRQGLGARAPGRRPPRPGRRPGALGGPGVVAFAGVVAGRGVVSVDHPGGLRTSYSRSRPRWRAATRSARAPFWAAEAVASHCPPAACLHWGCGGTGSTSTRARCSVRSGSGCCPLGLDRPGRVARRGAGGGSRSPGPARRRSSGTRGGNAGSGGLGWRSAWPQPWSGRQPCFSAAAEPRHSRGSRSGRRVRAGRAGRWPAGGSRPGRCRRGRRAGRSRGRRSC